jgi:hypothetical protein
MARQASRLTSDDPSAREQLGSDKVSVGDAAEEADVDEGKGSSGCGEDRGPEPAVDVDVAHSRGRENYRIGSIRVGDGRGFSSSDLFRSFRHVFTGPSQAYVSAMLHMNHS